MNCLSRKAIIHNRREYARHFYYCGIMGELLVLVVQQNHIMMCTSAYGAVEPHYWNHIYHRTSADVYQ